MATSSLLEKNSLNARETEYDNHLFRSRLEAKWAAFFNAMGLEYDYEPERYGSVGRGYLPDFFIPGLNRFIEIKSIAMWEIIGQMELSDVEEIPEIRRIIQAFPLLDDAVIIAFGEPSMRQYLLANIGMGWIDVSVFADCRRCDGICQIHSSCLGAVDEIWDDANNGGIGYYMAGKHNCGDHDRQPTMEPDGKLAVAYEQARKEWRFF